MMIDRMTIEKLVKKERCSADEKFPMFRSLHEGESVIREEIEEVTEELDTIMELHHRLWKCVRRNDVLNAQRAAASIYRLSVYLIAESIQVGAMAGKMIDSINVSEIERIEKLDREFEEAVNDEEQEEDEVLPYAGEFAGKRTRRALANAMKAKRPRMQKSGEKNLDEEKMKTLRNAGWSLAKIADEMGCSSQTVANRLNRMKKEARELAGLTEENEDGNEERSDA